MPCFLKQYGKEVPTGLSVEILKYDYLKTQFLSESLIKIVTFCKSCPWRADQVQNLTDDIRPIQFAIWRL